MSPTRRSTGAITLQDVAREAGVAKMTASVVLNGSHSGTQVSEATRLRILDVARRMGYRPNGVARGLTRRRMDTIGVVAPIYGGMNLYFMEILNGVLNEAVLRQQSANVQPIPGWSAPDVQWQILQYCDGRVDGIVLVGPIGIEAEFLESIQSHTPLVNIHANVDSPRLFRLDVDDEGGAYAAARYLTAAGHRRIAYLPGDLETRGGKDRLEGYRRALADAGLPYDPDLLLLPGSFLEESGGERTARLLDRAAGWPAERRPTAVCCANDATAVGCLRALAERGVRVPQEMSVTGFDDVISAAQVLTPLTTIRQPFLQIGARAVQLLLEQIQARLAGAAGPEPRTEVFGVELIVRSTVAPPRLPPP